MDLGFLSGGNGAALARMLSKIDELCIERDRLSDRE